MSIPPPISPPTALPSPIPPPTSLPTPLSPPQQKKHHPLASIPPPISPTTPTSSLPYPLPRSPSSHFSPSPLSSPALTPLLPPPPHQPFTPPPPPLSSPTTKKIVTTTTHHKTHMTTTTTVTTASAPSRRRPSLPPVLSSIPAPLNDIDVGWGGEGGGGGRRGRRSRSFMIPRERLMEEGDVKKNKSGNEVEKRREKEREKEILKEKKQRKRSNSHGKHSLSVIPNNNKNNMPITPTTPTTPTTPKTPTTPSKKVKKYPPVASPPCTILSSNFSRFPSSTPPKNFSLPSLGSPHEGEKEREREKEREEKEKEKEKERKKEKGNEGEKKKGEKTKGGGEGRGGGRRALLRKESSLMRGKLLVLAICKRNGITEEDLISYVVKIQKNFRFCLLRRRIKQLAEAYRGSDASQSQKTRNRVLMEIVESENVYVQSMKECYLNYFELLCGSGVLKNQEVEFIFGNFREIYGKNKALLFRLREAMRQWPKQNDFAATFLQLDQLMEPYRQYILHYPFALEKLKWLMNKKKGLRSFIDSRLEELGLNNTLPYYLIMPVQRMPRYELLLRELLKNTSETHIDFSAIKQAFQRITEVNHSMNEKQRQAQNAHSIYTTALELNLAKEATSSISITTTSSLTTLTTTLSSATSSLPQIPSLSTSNGGGEKGGEGERNSVSSSGSICLGGGGGEGEAPVVGNLWDVVGDLKEWGKVNNYLLYFGNFSIIYNKDLEKEEKESENKNWREMSALCYLFNHCLVICRPELNVRLQIPLFSEQDNFLLKRGLRIIF